MSSSLVTLISERGCERAIEVQRPRYGQSTGWSVVQSVAPLHYDLNP